jgi:hypothetical protein
MRLQPLAIVEASAVASGNKANKGQSRADSYSSSTWLRNVETPRGPGRGQEGRDFHRRVRTGMKVRDVVQAAAFGLTGAAGHVLTWASPYYCSV